MGICYRQMDSAATFISLFRCGDASCSWGQRRVSELIYVCYLAFFSSNVYIANFWGSQGTQLNCMLYIKCRPVNILRLYLFIQLLTYLLNTRIGDYTLLYFWTYLCGIHLLCTSVGTEELQDLETLQSLQLTKRTVKTSSYTKCS